MKNLFRFFRKWVEEQSGHIFYKKDPGLGSSDCQFVFLSKLAGPMEIYHSRQNDVLFHTHFAKITAPKLSIFI